MALMVPQMRLGRMGTMSSPYIEDETRQGNVLHLRNGRAKEKQMNDLHPYVQTLSISNVEDCVALENAVFPEHERCSREKVGLAKFTTILDFLRQASALHSFLF